MSTITPNVIVENENETIAKAWAEYINTSPVQLLANGRRVFPSQSKPAHVYMNGTLGVAVHGKTPGRVDTEYVKIGQTMNIQVA